MFGTATRGLRSASSRSTASSPMTPTWHSWVTTRAGSGGEQGARGRRARRSNLRVRPVLPLEGCNVLELAIWRPAPYAAQLLQELGAEIVKVEPPGGDPMRTYPRPLRPAGRGQAQRGPRPEVGCWSRPGASSWPPPPTSSSRIPPWRGRPARRGPRRLRAIRPSMVYVSVSGFGATGPLVLAPGHDVNYAAWSAALSPVTGPSPRPAAADRRPGGGHGRGHGRGGRVATRCPAHGRGGLRRRRHDRRARDLGRAPGRQRRRRATEAATGMRAYGVFAVTDGHVALGITTEDPFWNCCAALPG